MDITAKEEKETFRKELMDLLIERQYYIFKHKDSSPEINERINELKRSYAKKVAERMGVEENDKRKGK